MTSHPSSARSRAFCARAALLVLFFVLTSVGPVSCASDDGLGETCRAETSRTCECPNGGRSIQACDETTLEWAECRCDGVIAQPEELVPCVADSECEAPFVCLGGACAAPPRGACRNPADQAVLQRIPPSTFEADCSRCFDEDVDTRPCLTACYEEAFALTNACADCYANEYGCLLGSCIDACEDSFNDGECLACRRDEGCIDIVVACTGQPFCGDRVCSSGLGESSATCGGDCL